MFGDPSIEEVAGEIFGDEDSRARERWVEYWTETRDRTLRLLAEFEKLVLVDFHGKRVLDIGCGTGGLGAALPEGLALYVGADYHRHVLQFAEPKGRRPYLQCNAVHLPFRERSFDYIIAFDVAEHLVGGFPWQVLFFQELRRLLSPLGMILFTTPNFWYPYDAHSELYFPQFLPKVLRDRYIHWRNPGFIQEHDTFDNIRLMGPRSLKRALAESSLATLHELPCGLDRNEFARLHPLYGWTAYLGMGWYPHAEFWPILVRMEDRPLLRHKLLKFWYYERNQPSATGVRDFAPGIDFDTARFGHQLGAGWHWHESDRRGFRWTSARATCFLEARSPVRSLRISGFSPKATRFEVHVDATLVGEGCVDSESQVEADYLLPWTFTEPRLFEVSISVRNPVLSQETEDSRELGLMIFSMELTA